MIILLQRIKMHYNIQSYQSHRQILLVFQFQNFARLTISLNFFLPVLSCVAVYRTDREISPALALCSGEAYRNFFSTNYLFCKYENVYAKWMCRIWVYSNVLLMGNICDALIFFCCAKAIKEQMVASKDLLSKKSYINRRR